MTVCARRCVARLLTAIALLWTAPFAFAHASLLETEPADGAVLAAAPAQVRLRFNEPVAPLVFLLMAPDGSTRALDPPVSETQGLRASLPASTARGTYLLSWRVTSADGHPVGGALTYSVGAPSPLAVPSTALAAALLRPAIWTARLALYLALFVGIGGVLFRAIMQRPATAEDDRGPTIVPLALTAGFVALVCAVGLQGLDALNAPWPALLSVSTWRASLTTSYGLTAALMLLALAGCLAASSSRRAATLEAGAWVGAALLGAALAASGHASAAPPSWLARPTVFVHAVSVAIWVGSLLPLRRALRTPQRSAVLDRFSRVMPWVLLGLVASGATLALLQLDLSETIWSSDYGRVLIAKLMLVILLFGVAAVNRFGLTARVRQGDEGARRLLGRLIGLEIALVFVILALVATWRFTPPPRALGAAAPAHSVGLHLHGPQAMVELTLLPLGGQRWRAELAVRTHDLKALDAKELSIEWSRPALGLEPLQRPALRRSDGSWQVPAFALPAVGRWHLRVDILISDFERTTLEDDIDIPR